MPLPVEDWGASAAAAAPSSAPTPDRGSASPPHARRGVSDAERLASVTPPKPPPPYAAEANHERSFHGAQEDIALKYESAVCEAAALRRQVHALKAQMSRPSYTAGEPLPMEALGSPQRTSPQRTFNSSAEEAVWNAMDIDVITKLDAIHKVDCIRQEYEDTQRELQQELVVKEEVLSMLTEQLKGMVDRSQVGALRGELQRTVEELQMVRRENQLIASERDEQEERIKQIVMENSERRIDTTAAVQSAVAERQASLIDEIQDLNAELDEAKRQAHAVSQAAAELDERLHSTEETLAATTENMVEKDARIAQLLEVEASLLRSEGVVQDLADSLQAQALAHKQVLEEAQSRESQLEALKQRHDVNGEVVASLQRKLDDKERRHVETVLHLESRGAEVIELQTQLDGFTAHLQSHLLQKDEQMRRSQEALVEEVKMLKVFLSEGEARASVLQSAANGKIEEAQGEARAQAALVADLEAQQRGLKADMQEAVRQQMGLQESSSASHAVVERKLANTEAELDSQQRLTTRLGAELKERDELLVEQQDTITEMREKMDLCERLAVTLEEAQTQNKALTVENMELAQTVAQKAEECNAAEQATTVLRAQNNDTVEELTARLEGLQEVKRQLQLQVSQEAARAETMLMEKKKCEGTIAVLQQTQALQRKHLSENTSQAQSELQTTKESLGWFSKNLDTVSEQLHDRDSTIEAFRQACEAKDADIAKLKTLLQKSSETLDLLQECAERSGGEQKQQLETARQECAALEDQRSCASSAVSAAEEEAEGLRAQLRDVRDIAEEEKAAHEAEVAHLKEELEALQMRLTDVEESERQSQRSGDDAERTLHTRLAEEAEEHAVQRRMLTTRIQELEAGADALQGAERRAEQLQAQCDSSASEITQNQHLAVFLQENAGRAALQQDGLHWFSLHTLRQVREFERIAVNAREQKQTQQLLHMQETQAKLKQIDDEDKALTAAREAELHELVSTLRSRSSEAETSNRTARQLIEHMTDELQQRDTLLRSREQEARQAKESAVEAKRVLEQERRTTSMQAQDRDLEVAERDSLIARLQGARAELEAAGAGKETLLLELSNKMDEKSADMKDLHAALEETVAQVKVLRGQLNEREEEALSARQKYLQLESEHAGAVCEARRTQEESDAKLCTLEEELAARVRHLEVCNERLDAASRQLHKAEEDAATLRCSLTACKGELSAAQLATQTSEADAARLQLQLDTVRRAVDEKAHRLTDKQNEINRLRAEKEDAQHRSSSALSQLQSTDIHHIQSQNELVTQLELARHCAEVAVTGRDAVAAELREAQETHAHALSYAEQRAAQLQEQLAVLTAQSTSTSRAHEAALLAAETQNRDRVAIMQCDIDAKTQALKHMQASLDALQTAASRTDPSAHAERALAEVSSEVQRLSLELAAKEQALRTQASLVDVAQREGRHLKAALEDEVERVQRANIAVSDLHSTLRSHTQDTTRHIAAVKAPSDVLAARYRSLEASFCTPHISPDAEGWDAEVAAHFLRCAKQWCIDYTAVSPGLDSLMSLVQKDPLGSPHISPPRGRELLSGIVSLSAAAPPSVEGLHRVQIPHAALPKAEAILGGAQPERKRFASKPGVKGPARSLSHDNGRAAAPRPKVTPVRAGGGATFIRGK